MARWPKQIVPIGKRYTEPAVVTAISIRPSRPETVYAVSQYVVMRTNDSGRSWQRVSRGLPTGKPYYPWYGGDLVLDPVQPDVLHFVTHRRGLYRSANGGERWVRTSRSCARDCLARAYVAPAYGDYAQLAIDPTRPSRLYAAMPYAIHRTTDRGDRWRRALEINRGFGGGLAVARDGKVYVSGFTPDLRVARSDDGGVSWRRKVILRFKAAPRGRAYLAAGPVAVDPQNAEVVFAAVGAGNSGGGALCVRLLKTTNGGATWKSADLGLVPTGKGCRTL